MRRSSARHTNAWCSFARRVEVATCSAPKWNRCGGMGEVYRARDSKLQRDVAIKLLPSEFVADADGRRDSSEKRELSRR